MKLRGALRLFADDPRRDFPHRQRHRQHIARLDADLQRVLSRQVFQLGGAVQFGGGGAAALFFRGLPVVGVARDPLFNLALQVPVVSCRCVRVSRARRRLALCSDAAAAWRISGCASRSASRKEPRQFPRGIAKRRVLLQFVAHACSSDSGLVTTETRGAFRQAVHTPRLVSSDSIVYWKVKK